VICQFEITQLLQELPGLVYQLCNPLPAMVFKWLSGTQISKVDWSLAEEKILTLFVAIGTLPENLA
jgi:hypothetical protein